MKIICHRVNTVENLKEVDKKYGAEVDIRSEGNKLIIHHDPFSGGEDFEIWIKEFDHSFLILNVKEEGIEERLLSLLKKYDIKNFFFLDQSFPFIIKYSKKGVKEIALRVSEFESLDTAISLSGLCNWIWVDCFKRLPINSSDIEELRKNGFKLCYVSPELQGRGTFEDIKGYISELKLLGTSPDAVCTKFPEIWELSFGK